MRERGASEEEVVEAITCGEPVPAKHGRVASRRNFQYNRNWSGRFYHIKQVMPIIKKEEKGHTVVITVYTFYF